MIVYNIFLHLSHFAVSPFLFFLVSAKSMIKFKIITSSYLGSCLIVPLAYLYYAT